MLIEFENDNCLNINLISEPKNWNEPLNNIKNLHEIIVNEYIEIYKFDQKIVIKLNNFMSENVVTDFYNYIEDLKNSEEIIFDLRGNMGGNSGFANEIAQAFFTTSIHTEKASNRNINAENFASITQTLYYSEISKYNNWLKYSNYQYLEKKNEYDFYPNRSGLLKNKKVIILIDQTTYSSAENFVMIFENYDKATIIGDNSAGSTGQPALIKLKTGGTFMVTSKKVVCPNGNEHHNLGIAPSLKLENKITNRLYDYWLIHVLSSSN